MTIVSDKSLYERLDRVICDDEYCGDCGENASVYRFGTALCQSCAMADIDDAKRIRGRSNRYARAGR